MNIGTQTHSSDKRADASAKATPRPACSERPDDWDLDTGTPDTWRQAVRTCQACPLLAQCSQLAETLTGRGQAPRAMIWAGVGYDASGNVIENLDRHRTAPIDHKRPTTIIRTAPVQFEGTARLESAPEVRPHHHEPTPASPRRQIVIRRRVV